MNNNFTNPLIWADVPDPSVVRVGDVYYMTSTTMHMTPGVPIMKSCDLVNWEIVGYVYDTLLDTGAARLIGLHCTENMYGQGSWASCLRYHNGIYYVSFLSAHDFGKTYIFATEDIEKGPWTKNEIDRGCHDASLLFDDDGRAYFVYPDAATAKILELDIDGKKADIKDGGVDKVIIANTASFFQSGGLSPEGYHTLKKDGWYYIFMITWPHGHPRLELCWRSRTLDSGYEGIIALEATIGGRSDGVAQGGVFDTADGRWYAMLFQDRGAVGRVPVLVKVTWQDDWPVFRLESNDSGKSIVKSDDFDNGKHLRPEWQWNHNTDSDNWSLTERVGWLRLRVGSTAESVLTTRNVLTQRTMGPVTIVSTQLDTTLMNNGDTAGLVAFAGQYALVGVQKASDGEKTVVMMSKTTNDVTSHGKLRAAVPFSSEKIYLKAALDFTTDTARFFYSFDEINWNSIGEEHLMRYNWNRMTGGHFMGYRAGLFIYGVEVTGGIADFNYFRYSGH